MYKQVDIFSDLIALDLGIIHPTIANAEKDEQPGSIDETLASMSREESRICRRKFRKIMRKQSRADAHQKWSPCRKRFEVMMRIRSMAWTMTKQGIDSDNDEV